MASSKRFAKIPRPIIHPGIKNSSRTVHPIVCSAVSTAIHRLIRVTDALVGVDVFT